MRALRVLMSKIPSKSQDLRLHPRKRVVARPERGGCVSDAAEYVGLVQGESHPRNAFFGPFFFF